MFLALVAWLLLSSQCNCQQNFTLFMTGCPSAVTPDPTPDQVCASADGNDTSVEYRALVVLSNRRDLSAMFPDGSLLLNTLGEVMAYNLSQFLDPQARLALLYDSLSVLVGNDTLFWTGAVDNFGNLSDGNCADFTPDFVTRNWVWANIGTLDSGLYAGRALCDQAYVYLCAKGNFPQLTPASGSPSDVHVFLTDEVNPHAGFDADVFCKQQSTQSPSPILQVAGLEVQAVAFTARRQNLHAMFPPDASIFDLDGNFLAANSVDFFTLLSPVSIRGSNGAIIDASVRFWTGTAADNLSGNLSGITCGDWTKGTTEGGATVGTLTYGLCSGSVSCGETARFLCAANVLPQAPTLGDPGATYLFFSQPVVVGTEELNATNTPDMLCQAAADMANNSKFDGRQCIALVLTEARPTLEAYFQPGPVEDLNNNTLAPNMSDFWANNLVTTRSLTFADGEHVDIDYWFWSGGTATDDNCENFTAAVQSTMAGTLMYGRGSQGVECAYALSFLCAALAPPTPAPTSSPTATPTTAAPTRTPSAAPTTMTTTTPAPSSAVVSANVTWNGTKTVLALGGGAIRQVEVTVSPDVAFGQNGTVEVAVLGNNSNTISTVVSVVFRDANGAALNVTNLTKPIVLGFSLSSSLADVKHCIDANPVESPLLPQCGYYNTSTDTWETNGCSLATVNATWLQCECTHLTDFAVLAPKSNKIVPTDTLDLTPDNIAHNSTGLVAVLVMLAIFGIVFALAWRRDHSEAVEYAKLRGEKQEKWSSFMAEKKKTTFVKQVKIAFQKRHTWLSLVFRRAGTSFKSVDRTFVAMLSVFASMSMSANFHAQDNEGVSRVVSWFLTVIACVVPAQFLMILFVRTGEMGFFEEWEYVSSGQVGPSNKCLAFRFPEQWRYAWRAATLIAVIGMIVYILTMSMRFDLQPYYYCQGEPAKAWVVTWLSAYAITAFGYEPLRLVLLASIAYQMDSREAATLKTLEMTAKDAEK